jgi:hypothetical protein
MSDLTSVPNRVPTGRRPLTVKPERIIIGADTFIRDDIIAAECGISKRTLARADAKGAPHVFIGGMKYRPRKVFDAFMAAQIIVRGQAKPNRRGKHKR